MPTCEHCHKYPAGQCPCPCHKAAAIIAIAATSLYEAQAARMFFGLYARLSPERLRVASMN